MNLSEAFFIFEDHLPDIRKACVTNISAIAVAYQPSKELTDTDELTVENIKAHVNHLVLIEKTESMLRTIKRIDSRKAHFSAQSITDQDIVRAKEYPIVELWNELVSHPVRGGMTKCCFHEDKTASMSLRRYNRFHCFGCDAKGSVIDLYMKLNNVDFITAVKFLRGKL